jgi:hypothetical protein
MQLSRSRPRQIGTVPTPAPEGPIVSSRLAIASAAALLAATLTAAPLPPVSSPRTAQSDLDAFMQKVLARRDENWKKLQQYILDEEERIEVRGPSNLPVWGEKREYAWFIQDGFFVRSPVKADGVDVPEEDRRKYEASFLRRMKERDKQRIERLKNAPEGTEPAARSDPGAPGERVVLDSPKDVEAFLTQTRQPVFIDSAYFLRFKFEEGKYALVGREKVQDTEALRIEYYPARLFSHEQDAQKKRNEQKKPNRGEDMEAAMERLMNKVALVTIWVEPKSHQIVKYTFDNVNFDFLPAAWLVRINDLKASMTMSQPFKDVWLPKDVDMYFGAMVAVGSFNVRYHIDYKDYREAKTSGRIKGGKQ